MMYDSHSHTATLRKNGMATQHARALHSKYTHTRTHKSASVLAHNKVDMITLFIRATNYAHTHTKFLLRGHSFTTHYVRSNDVLSAH